MQSSRPPESAPISIQDYLNSYLGSPRLTHSQSTIHTTNLAAERFCEFIEPQRKLGAVKASDFDTYTLHRLGSVRPTTVSIELRHLRAAFRAAVRPGNLSESSRVKLLRIPERRMAYFTTADLQMLLDGLGRSPWAQRFVLFTYATGMRRNEIVHLRWEDVDLTSRLVYVRNTEEFTTKSRRERTIPLNATPVYVLQDVGSRNGYVFRGRFGGRVDPRLINRLVRKAVKAQGLDPRLHLHGLRYSFCTIPLQAGATIQEVQRLAGHFSISVTGRYNQMTSDSLHHADALLDQG